MTRVACSGCLLNLSPLPFVFFLLLINYAALLVRGEPGCTTSCGKLHIPYPFRVRDDPQHCGDPDYELVCEGGETVFFYTDTHRYIVTYIQYSDRGEGSMTVHVDCPFTTSTCRLHHNSSSFFPEFLSQYSWASFMSCLEKIEDDTFLPLPSLSGENTTVYVVVGNDANELSYLHKSCKFVDTFLFPYDSHINSSMQVIETLQKGFNISWYRNARDEKYSWITILRFIADTVVVFFSCLADKVFQIHINTSDDYEGYCLLPISTYFLGYVFLALFVCKFVLSPLTICIYLLYNYWVNTKPLDSVEKFLQSHQVLMPRRYTYGEITVITRHFKEKLGKGGFGQVYKGELLGGRPVAVKILDGLKFNGEDFINEVSTIGMIHHVNIVQLLGFCSDGTKRALIYEYMPNGSLDRYIFSSYGNGTNFSLTLEKLSNIALGIAKGINYLHTGCDLQILHFDIKPHNILLDSNFNPKVSDFGLAKLYPKEQTLVSISAARGTIGYIAPELISRSFGVISQKSDVYSFGMLIMEIAGRRRNFDTRAQNSKEVYYPSWIYDRLTQLQESNFIEITDIGDLEKRLCKVGLWCIQMNSSNRPTMSEVVKMLESDVDDIEMPPKPFFMSTDATMEENICAHSSSLALPPVVEHDDLSTDDLV